MQRNQYSKIGCIFFLFKMYWTRFFAPECIQHYYYYFIIIIIYYYSNIIFWYRNIFWYQNNFNFIMKLIYHFQFDRVFVLKRKIFQNYLYHIIYPKNYKKLSFLVIKNNQIGNWVNVRKFPVLRQGVQVFTAKTRWIKSLEFKNKLPENTNKTKGVNNKGTESWKGVDKTQM